MRRADEVESLLPLTSLRFVAAMMIVIRHAKLYFPWPIAQVSPDALSQGVSFFFVLSGFILTHVYTSKSFPGYGQFLKARFARLWPIHVFAILMLVTFVRSDSITFDGQGIFNRWVQLGFDLALVQSFVPFVSAQFSWNTASWSISTEMAFYLVFPLLLVNIRRTWHWKLAGAAVLLAVILVAITAAHLPADGSVQEITVSSLTYTNPLVRVFEFCIGMATWAIWDRYIKPIELSESDWTSIEVMLISAIVLWIGWGSVASVSHVRNVALRDYLGMAGSAPLFALLILVMAQGRGIIAGMLAWKPFVFLGEISFSVYMLHMILMKMFFTWNQAAIVSPLAFMGALLFIASGSYVMIEKPARRFIMRKRRPAVSSVLWHTTGGSDASIRTASSTQR